MNQTSETNRRIAWTTAKLAVRSYAREPSDSNADKVETALRKVRSIARPAGDERSPMTSNRIAS